MYSVAVHFFTKIGCKKGFNEVHSFRHYLRHSNATMPSLALKAFNLDL